LIEIKKREMSKMSLKPVVTVAKNIAKLECFKKAEYYFSVL